MSDTESAEKPKIPLRFEPPRDRGHTTPPRSPIKEPVCPPAPKKQKKPKTETPPATPKAERKKKTTPPPSPKQKKKAPPPSPPPTPKPKKRTPPPIEVESSSSSSSSDSETEEITVEAYERMIEEEVERRLAMGKNGKARTKKKQGSSASSSDTSLYTKFASTAIGAAIPLVLGPAIKALMASFGASGEPPAKPPQSSNPYL